MTTQVDEHVAPGPGWVRLRRGPLLLLPPSSWAGSSCSFACHWCSWRRRRGRRGRWLCAVKYSFFWQDQWSETCSYRKHSRHGRPGLKTASIIEVSGRYQFIQGQRGGFPFVHLSGLRRRRVSTCSRCSDGRRHLGFVCGFFAFLLLLLLLLELGCRTVRGLTSANSEFSP